MKFPIEVKGIPHHGAVNNETEEALVLHANPIMINKPECKYLVTRFLGENLKNSGGCLYVNGHPIPLDGETLMELAPPVPLNFELRIPAQSAVRIDKIEVYCEEEAQGLTEKCSADADVLVVCPDYPSTHNLYLCAFVESRVRAYISQGLKVQVAAIGERWYEQLYRFGEGSVYSGNYFGLKQLLSRKQYKVIVTHFVDVPLMQIYDGYITNEQMIFICHGPETSYKRLNNVCRPYFTAPLAHEDQNPEFDERDRYVQRYAQKDNVEWVFVSDWFRTFSEACCGCTFKHSRVINNLIDKKIFPYHKKTAEDRKKILILRKFDNISVHAIDESVFTILELSRRPFFKELTFEVYGDGIYWAELTAPLRQFDNVHIHRTFVPNAEISKIHEKNGILLIPSRHDSQGVSMGEGASSGLVTVGSAVTTIPLFMNQEVNRTCAEPENFTQLADIIERLYRNPDEYLEISERMSRETQARCCAEQTVNKEVALIRERLADAQAEVVYPQKTDDAPVLTIVVPAYQVEKYLEKCLHTLCMHRNAAKTEIIVVNDGSKDRTSEIAHAFEHRTGGIVRVIDKENGGHGSTINAGIRVAKGKYFRLIDGDDWVDSENLAKLVDILEKEESDLVLTKGCYEYVEQKLLQNIIDYPMLREGVQYHFEDLLYPNYGFKEYGPLLTTGSYKTDCLQKAGFQIAEKRPYVDMEFNAFAQRFVDTVVHYDLDIYRYLIGREGQTVSRGFWKKKYMDHCFVIFDILKKLDQWPDYTQWKKTEYVYKHMLAMMIDSQVFMYDQLCLWPEIEKFLEQLEQWPEAKAAGLEYIERKNDASKHILAEYKRAIQYGVQEPLVGEDGSLLHVSAGGGLQKTALPAAVVADAKRALNLLSLRTVKKLVKGIIPYGIIRIYQKKHYGA